MIAALCSSDPFRILDTSRLCPRSRVQTPAAPTGHAGTSSAIAGRGRPPSKTSAPRRRCRLAQTRLLALPDVEVPRCYHGALAAHGQSMAVCCAAASSPNVYVLSATPCATQSE